MVVVVVVVVGGLWWLRFVVVIESRTKQLRISRKENNETAQRQNEEHTIKHF